MNGGIHSMKRRLVIAFFAVVFAAQDGALAALSLTQAPAGMRRQNADITLAWTGGQGRVHIRASTVPGGSAAPASHYDSLHLPGKAESGAFTFRINPDIPAAYRNTDLRLGVNYCILSDGSQRSAEFVIIVESGNAPALLSPANAASLKDLSPVFSWSGDAPYYALLISDEPFRISDSGTVTGVSAIWQIITPFTSARYGQADPSGLNAVPAPPLISGKTYNWLVLNNYGNNSASTSKVAPVPSSFVYSPSPPLPAAGLLEPGDSDTIPGADRILFRWTQVEGAVSYKLELLEENLVDGSQADVVLWTASSTGGQLTLENATGLLRRYRYKWRVYAVGNNGSASLSGKRSFFFAVDVGDINVNVRNQAGQKIAYAPVKLNRLGGASSAVYQGGSTDGEGSLSVKNAPLGAYEVRLDNPEGYRSKTDTLLHNAKSGTSRTITLTPVLGKILGRVRSAGSGTGIHNARITAIGSDGAQWISLSNSQGDYSLGLPYGNWQVRAQAEGHQASGSQTVSLGAAANARSSDFSLQANKFTLSGTVRNSFTNQGVFGANVFLTQGGVSRSVVTDGNGGFAFSSPTGPLSIRVSSPGFASPETRSLLFEGDVSLDLRLDPNASILSGRTRDASGTALEGVTVLATPKSGTPRGVVSGNGGVYEMSLPSGDWVIAGALKGYSARNSHKFLLDVSKTVQGADLSFDANRSLVRGRVTINGTGLAGARVWSTATPIPESPILTDNSGYYHLPLVAGAHSLRASKEGFLISRIHSLQVNAGDTVSGMDFPAAGNAGIIKGRVSSGGAGVAGAEVSAVNQSTREIFRQTAGGAGAFSLSLPGGAYLLSGAREGFIQDQVLSVSVPPGGTVLDADLRLQSDRAGLNGTVASGNRALGACELAYRNASDAALQGRTVTDPQGGYSLSLQAGSAYVITASCMGFLPSTITTASLSRGAGLSQDFNLAKAAAVYRGTTVDGKGAVLPGVKVVAERIGETDPTLPAHSALSDFAGQYALALASGTYSMTFAKSGYRTIVRSAQLTLGENQSARHDTLSASVGRLAGRVASGGTGVSGAVAALIGLTPDAGGRVLTTDAEGRFAGENLPAGAYSLSVRADGYAEGRIASLNIAPSQTAQAELELVAERGSISGTVTSAGAPSAGAEVTASAYGISSSALSGSDGKYSIAGLPAGVYAISAGRPGFSPDKAYEGQSLPSHGALIGLDFSLIRNAGSLTGVVSGAANAAGIRISLAGRKGGRAYAACDGSGRFHFPSLPSDIYALSVTAPGYKLTGADPSPEVPVAGPAEYHPALVPAVFRLAGKLTDQSGRAIAGIPLVLSISGEDAVTLSGGDGTYAFAEVPAGQVYRLACRPPNADYDPVDTAFAQGLDAEPRVTVDLRTLSRLASLSGTVLQDGRPLEGALVRLYGNGNNIAVVSQPSGAFKVPGVAGSDTRLRLSVSKPGANTLDTTLEIKTGQAAAGMTLNLKTLKLEVSAIFKDSEGRLLTRAKAVAVHSGRLDSLTTDDSGALSLTGIAGNQTLTLATSLDRNRFDNVEMSVSLGERDTALELTAVVHATVVTLETKDQNGDDVDGAEILQNGKAVGKSSQGRFVIGGLARGDHRFAAGKAGYKSGSVTAASLSGDTTATVRIGLIKVEGGFFGSVSDSGLLSAGGPASGNLPGALVRITAGADTLTDTVDAMGRYSIGGLETGRAYGISLYLPGYAPHFDSVQASVQAVRHDVKMRPVPGSVVGRVENGRKGVEVGMLHEASGRRAFFTTVAGGYYAFTGLQNRGDYTVQAADGDFGSQPFAVQAGAGSALRLDLPMENWGRIEGAVSAGPASSPWPLAGATISARHSVNGSLARTISDSLGRFTLAGLASGAYALAADSKGYRPASLSNLNVSKGKALAGIGILMEAVDAGVSGLVADQAGAGLESQVDLIGDEDTLRIRTDGSGQFVFAGLPAGDYRLSASKFGYAGSPEEAIAYDGKGMVRRKITLERMGNSVYGIVRDALTNAPLAGAALRLGAGSPVASDGSGRFALPAPAGAESPVFVEASLDGYIARAAPVYLDADGSASQDISLSADYKFDGSISLSVMEGGSRVRGLSVSLQSSHPDDGPELSVTGSAPNSFSGLRRPAPYTVKVARPGFQDLSKVVELTAGSPAREVTLAYPTSQVRVFVSSDGRRGKSVGLFLNGADIAEHGDSPGLYAGPASMRRGAYEVAIRDRQEGIIPLDPYFLTLGEDTVRTDTLPLPFYGAAIPDSVLGTSFRVAVRRADTLVAAPGVLCSLHYRPVGDPLWRSLALDSIAGGFEGTLPAQSIAGEYEYYHSLRSPYGARIGIATGEVESADLAGLRYSDMQSPRKFSLRDPFLLHSLALSPQRLEADTSLYSLRAKDVFQAHLRGEGGRSLDGHFDERASAGDTGVSLEWNFADPGKAAASGLALTVAPEDSPRRVRFSGGAEPQDSVFQVICSARMGAVRLKKSFLVRIQDLTPVAIGIRYVRENRIMEEGGAALALSNRTASGYGFAAFARTAEGRQFNISPRWSFGTDSAVGTISQQGLFLPDSSVARGAILTVFDTLPVAVGEDGAPLYGAFSFPARISTFAQVQPSPEGRTVVADGEGTFLDFNLAGLSKAFTVTVNKPKVSGLLRSSPREEVVGEILDIELSESQPFKADSGAVLRMPIGPGIARQRTVFLGHWNSARLAWEKVDSAEGDTAVAGRVFHFSKYAVLMGSLPLGAYDFTVAPNPFTALDPWGLQLGYKVSSDVSSQVGVRVEVYNMMGDKVYESQEQLLGKGEVVRPGTRKAGPGSPDRRVALGPYVWDGRDSRGALCRNGRYLLKLIVRDGRGRKEYLKKVVMLK